MLLFKTFLVVLLKFVVFVIFFSCPILGEYSLDLYNIRSVA